MRIAELVKTYKLLNDPDAPAWNVKFLGVAVAGLLLVAGLAAVAHAGREGAAPAAVGAGDARTAYVGYDAQGLDAAPDERALAAALAIWMRAHPEATVHQVEPVAHEGRVIGYRVTYTP